MAGAKHIWYAVHVVVALERKKAPRFAVFENIYLVFASSRSSARRRGTALGRSDVVGMEGMTWNREAVRASFCGIRKIVSCAADVSRRGNGDVTRLHDGVEASYSVFLLKGKREVRKFVDGKPVAVTYDE